MQHPVFDIKQALATAKEAKCPDYFLMLLHSALQHDYVFDTIQEDEDNEESFGPYTYTERFDSRTELLTEYRCNQLLVLSVMRKIVDNFQEE